MKRECFLNLLPYCFGRGDVLAAAFVSAVLGIVSPWRSDAAAQTTVKGEVKSISLGLVSEINRAAVEKHFRDFAGYVARRLSPANNVEGKVVVAGTSFELVKLLEQRRVDFYLESVYPTYTINYVHNAGRTLLRRWKGGMSEYQSLIFTQREGGVRRLEELRGKTIAFEDAGSTSGFLMPKFFLQRRGFKLAEKREFDANAPAADIQYFFAGSQQRLVDAVLSRRSAAGAFSDDDHAHLSENEKAQISVLAQTERFPRHLVSVRADLAPALVSRLEEVLLAMHESDEGRAILGRTDQTSKFDRLPGGEAALRRRLLDSFFAPDRK
jgi:phosphonate transport system substrate-binding protein